MKRETKRLVSALLGLALVLGLMSGTALTALAEEPVEPLANEVQESPDAEPLADEVPQLRVASEPLAPQSQEPVRYVERSWDENAGVVTEEEKECAGYTLVTSNSTDESVSWNSGWYVVQGEKTINGRLSITGEAATAHLILCDGARLTVKEGITTTGATLNIYAQSGDSGVLYAGTTDGTTSTCLQGNAGIGGNPEYSGGTINIHGGSVTAIGGNEGGGDLAGGAGIGGGYKGSGGTVNIHGGSVTAIGGRNAAGIGSGLGSNNHSINGGAITIYGGTVNATAGAVSAGIGGGYVADSGIITINGGTVNANSSSGAGIGGGNYSYTIDGNKITINGGVVNAAGSYGAGIGSGHDGGSCTITINGGTVTATGDNNGGAGIGCGYVGVSDGIRSINVTINGGTVIATGDVGAGIGAGEDAPKRNYKYAIAINGGTVTATSTSAWGIGSSTDEVAGTVTLGEGVCVLAGESEATAVDVTGTFAQSHDHKWAHTELKYSVAIADGIKNGTVEVDKSSAFANEVVKITAKAADGYELDTVTVRDAEGNPVEVKGGSFAMPASNVTVSATFSKKAGPALELAGSGHEQGVGEVAAKASGKGILIGTTGESKRLESFSVALPKDVEGSIEYRAHLQGTGWVGWSKDGAPCGTAGQSRRVEAVQMRLTGKVADTHSVWYRAHCQTFGWLGWACDGQAAGTAGQSKRAEAIEVQVLPKGQVPEGYAEGQASYVGAATANVHVQGAGWTDAGSALEFGTTGQGRRLEAVRLSVPNQPVAGGISYEVHAQGRGWMPAAADGALAGTEGQSRRLEAVRVSLTGDLAKEGGYSVWYRVHSQTYGWLGWAHDGEPAGTTGLSRRAEAIDVQVLPQGQVPRGYDAGKAACVKK